MINCGNNNLLLKDSVASSNQAYQALESERPICIQIIFTADLRNDNTVYVQESWLISPPLSLLLKESF